MSKDDILFLIIGLLLGLIIGYKLTESYNQRAAAPVAAANPAAAAPANAPAPNEPGAPEPLADPQVLAAAQKRAQDEPQNFDAQMQAGGVFYQANRYTEAADFLIKANKLRPDAPEPMVLLGNTYFDDATRNNANDKWPLAEKWYSAALAKDGKNINARTDLGLTFFKRDPPDYARALKEFQASLALDPRHEPTLLNTASVYLKMSNAKDAQATLDKLAQVNPNNPALAQLREDLAKIK